VNIPAAAAVPTPIAAFTPPGLKAPTREMPTDTGSIVAALTDTSETPAGQDESPKSRRDSEFPTMALPADQVAALQRKALADAGGAISEKPAEKPTHELTNTTDEHPVFDFSDETIARPFEAPKIESEDDDDVVIVDDLAEEVIIEGEEEAPKKPHSSMPPIPRT